MSQELEIESIKSLVDIPEKNEKEETKERDTRTTLPRDEANEMVDPMIVRTNLMERYHEELHELEAAYQNNLEQVQRERPLILVQVAIWEEDASELAFKMWENSLNDLMQQAELAGMDLDVIMIANNGGGATEEIGDNLRGNIKQLLQTKYGKAETYVTSCHKPENKYSLGTPWPVETGLNQPRTEGTNRLILIEQPIDYDEAGTPTSNNAGKLRALRDANHAFASEIRDGYAPDAILTLDAESILHYKEGTAEGLGEEIPPLKVLYNKYKRKGLKAVGTKDVFKIMDPSTGKPLSKPANSAQQGYMVTNNRTITLPGGATLSAVPEYVAAMEAISEITPSAGVEDYLFTQMLRFDALDDGQNFDTIASTDTIVRHVNKTPDEELGIKERAGFAIKGEFSPGVNQMRRWYRQARAVNKLFPELEGDSYGSETLPTYVKLVVLDRLRTTIRERDPKHLLQLLKDASDIPQVIRLLNEDEVADIFKGSASWTHTGSEN